MVAGVRATRSIEAYERDEGAGMPILPWSTPRDAAAHLSAPARKRLSVFRKAVRDAWLSPAAHESLAHAFAALDPGSMMAIYPGAPPGGPTWMWQTITGNGLSDGKLKNHHRLPEVRLYLLHGRDPFAGRPVANAPLLRANAVASRDPFVFLDIVLTPNEVPKQLRMVLYERDTACLYAGFYRSKRHPRFDVDDHALLYAARPTLQTWNRIARAIGPRPLGDTAMVETLEALRAPALLLRRGRVVFANAAGRAFVGATNDWQKAGSPSGFGDVTRVRPNGFELDLVLPYSKQAHRSVQATLPPSLGRVAEHLARGASDKEIAAALAMPLPTVRTYVTRVFARLGVRGRRELMLSKSK